MCQCILSLLEMGSVFRTHPNSLQALADADESWLIMHELIIDPFSKPRNNSSCIKHDLSRAWWRLLIHCILVCVRNHMLSVLMWLVYLWVICIVLVLSCANWVCGISFHRPYNTCQDPTLSSRNVSPSWAGSNSLALNEGVWSMC